MHILITGANRGISQGFMQHDLSRGHSVWACHRDAPGAMAAIGSTSLHLLRRDEAFDGKVVPCQGSGEATSTGTHG